MPDGSPYPDVPATPPQGTVPDYLANYVQGQDPPWYSNLGIPGGGGGALPLAGIKAGGGVLAALIGSHGATDAANIQAQYLREALAYEQQRDQYLQGLERQRYANVQTRLGPYMALGQSAAERLGSLLGLSTTLPGNAPGPAWAPVTQSVSGAIQPTSSSGVYDQLTGRFIPEPTGPGSNTPGRGGGGWAGGPLGPGNKAY